MTTQAAQRRTNGFHPEHLIAVAPDGYTALAAAILSMSIHDCRAGDAGARAWLVTGPGRCLLSLLLPSATDEAELYRKLRALAPDVIQLPMFDGVGAST